MATKKREAGYRNRNPVVPKEIFRRNPVDRSTPRVDRHAQGTANYVMVISIMSPPFLNNQEKI